MNDLSWFLYAAGAVPALATAVGALSIVAGLLFGIIFLFYLIDKSENGTNWQSLEPYRHTWVLCLTVFILSFTVPDRETFYAIAVSEMGEEVLKSEVGNKATEALEAWLDKQIEDQQEDNEE